MIFQIGLVQTEPLALDFYDGIDNTLDVGLTSGVVRYRKEVDIATNLMLTCV